MTRLEALKELRQGIIDGRLPWSDTNAKTNEIARLLYSPKINRAFTGSLDAATEWLQQVLPGWGWRVGACHLSDDAFVFPDYNCPTHGERLKREFPQLPDGCEWSDFTDIDQRPAGNVARALLRSTLTALITIEEAKADV